jgi:hypothetical protein
VSKPPEPRRTSGNSRRLQQGPLVEGFVRGLRRVREPAGVGSSYRGAAAVRGSLPRSTGAPLGGLPALPAARPAWRIVGLLAGRMVAPTAGAAASWCGRWLSSFVATAGAKIGGPYLVWSVSTAGHRATVGATSIRGRSGPRAFRQPVRAKPATRLASPLGSAFLHDVVMDRFGQLSVLHDQSVGRYA